MKTEQWNSCREYTSKQLRKTAAELYRFTHGKIYKKKRLRLMQSADELIGLSNSLSGPFPDKLCEANDKRVDEIKEALKLHLQ